MQDKTDNKILIISPFARPNLGGVESHIDKLISYSVKKNLKIVLITYQPLTRSVRGDPHEIGNGYEIFRVKWFGMGLFNTLENYFPLQFMYLFPGIFIKSLFYCFSHHKEISCIHAHGLAAAAAARILKSIYGVRIVVSTHAVYSFEDRKILSKIVKWLFLRFDQILAVSEVSRNELIKTGIPGDKIKVHPNWIDTDVFKVLDIKKEPGSSKLNILFIGRLIEKKGINILLEVVPFLPEITFHIVGDGPEKQAVKEAVNKYINLKYYGVLTQFNDSEQRKIIELYNLCDYLISPYLYDEGFSTTLIESLACGTPDIVSNRGSPPTFLNSDIAVFLSSAPGVEEIKDTLKRLINKPKNSEIQNKCREYAVNNFGFNNPEVIIKSYEP